MGYGRKSYGRRTAVIYFDVSRDEVLTATVEFSEDGRLGALKLYKQAELVAVEQWNDLVVESVPLESLPDYDWPDDYAD